MNSLRNLPIVLEYQEDGTVHAHCPLLAGCECKAPTRTMALRMVEQSIKRMRAEGTIPSLKAHKYEVIHLALIPVAADPSRHRGAGARKRALEHSTPEP
ncbi:hypothetical protein [Pendulispora albinea]|uniref:Type II toxin-antitoxin system HicB family antitoxin n=1 Tax=Pendulispora albinea TaxID=2741071 RepID=A0ABZ2M7I4_9BACT